MINLNRGEDIVVSSETGKKLDWHGMYDAGFTVLRTKPSLVVQNLVRLFGIETLQDARVLDLGCGELRNSIFLAESGANVDAIDVVRPSHVLDHLAERVSERLSFRCARVQDVPLAPESYDFVICTRLLQYLSPLDAEELLGRLPPAIKAGGGLALNYVVVGGMIGDESAPTETFSYESDWVRHKLEQAGLRTYSCEVGEVGLSARVPLFEARSDSLTACDLVGVK